MEVTHPRVDRTRTAGPAGLAGGPAALEELAEQCAASGDYAGAVRLREQAYAAYRAQGDLARSAVLAAYQLAFDYVGLYGNQTVAAAWLARGIRLAEELGDCAEAGWVALARALHASDRGERDHWIDVASDAADRFGDQDLAFDALAYAGLSLVETAHVVEGMQRLDEAAVAARSGEVGSSVVVGEIYCKMLAACELCLDVTRAEQWREVIAPLTERPAVAWATAICGMHYGGILVVAGRWDEAEAELGGAVQTYDRTYPALRVAALVRLAELRVRQGRLREAERLLMGHESDEYGIRPRVRLHLARTETHRATTLLERRLRDGPDDVAAVPLLGLLVEARLAGGHRQRARAAAFRLSTLTTACPQGSLRAYAEYAAGLTADLDGGTDAGGSLADLERAVESFTGARLPLEAARARLALAAVLPASRREAALADCEVAAEIFAGLGAAADLDAASQLLRRLGGRARTGPRHGEVVSEREREVLALLAQGLSNREIAGQLYISTRTAAHHVSHVLAKLGVRNRAEAAAWASERGLHLNR